MMKSIFLTTMGLLLTCHLFAQEKLLTHDKTYIDSTMNAEGNIHKSDALATDTKLPISIYQYPSNGQMVLFYYDKNNICVQCAAMRKREDLDTVLSSLNEGFTKQGGINEWIRDDNKLKVGILIQKSSIVIKYTSL